LVAAPAGVWPTVAGLPLPLGRASSATPGHGQVGTAQAASAAAAARRGGRRTNSRISSRVQVAALQLEVTVLVLDLKWPGQRRRDSESGPSRWPRHSGSGEPDSWRHWQAGRDSAVGAAGRRCRRGRNHRPQIQAALMIMMIDSRSRRRWTVTARLSS
jgi:hypothetical protein